MNLEPVASPLVTPLATEEAGATDVGTTALKSEAGAKAAEAKAASDKDNVKSQH